jgi:hypothetical protein
MINDWGSIYVVQCGHLSTHHIVPQKYVHFNMPIQKINLKTKTEVRTNDWGVHSSVDRIKTFY